MLFRRWKTHFWQPKILKILYLKTFTWNCFKTCRKEKHFSVKMFIFSENVFQAESAFLQTKRIVLSWKCWKLKSSPGLQLSSFDGTEFIISFRLKKNFKLSNIFILNKTCFWDAGKRIFENQKLLKFRTWKNLFGMVTKLAETKIYHVVIDE